MTLAVCLLVMAAALAGSIVLLVVTGRRDRVLSPVIFFVGTEVAAVWPPLIPGSRSAVIGNDGGPLVLAATAMLTFVVAYVLMGGARANQARWRGFRPDERQLSNLSRGLLCRWCSSSYRCRSTGSAACRPCSAAASARCSTRPATL